MQRWNALQHSSFAAPPGSCDLLTTAGPTRQGDDTPTLTYLEKAGPAALTVRGLSRHLVWKKARLRMNSLRDPTRQGGVVPTLFCAGCAMQCASCPSGRWSPCRATQVSFAFSSWPGGWVLCCCTCGVSFCCHVGLHLPDGLECLLHERNHVHVLRSCGHNGLRRG